MLALLMLALSELGRLAMAKPDGRYFNHQGPGRQGPAAAVA